MGGGAGSEHKMAVCIETQDKESSDKKSSHGDPERTGELHSSGDRIYCNDNY